MRSAKLYRYRLPMDSGVILRDERLVEREGFIVEMHEGDRTGYGEVAPLSGFNQESTDEAGIQIQDQLALWVKGEQPDLDHLYPSVAFGFSAAELELSGEFPQEGSFFAAPLGAGDPDALIEKLKEMPGNKVAKIKVGLYEAVRDGLVTSLLLEAIPDLSLRLDANRAWTLDKAKQFASKISPSVRQRIAYIEEPCKSPSDSITFAIETGIAVGWDETLQQSLRDPEFKLEDLMGVKTIIIKPTMIGSVQRCQYLIEKAKKLAIQPVISSSFESSLGLCQLARLSRWWLPDETPGLDTINLFKQQLAVSWPGCELPVASLSDQEVIWQS